MDTLVFKSHLGRSLAGALIINLALFCSLPGLISVSRQDNDVESLNVVNFTRIKPEQPPPPEKPKKEEKEQEEPKKVVKMTQTRPTRVTPKNFTMNLPQMDLDIDPRLTGGVPVVAPPPRVQPRATVDFNGLFDMDDLDTIPVPSFKTNPRYPYRAKRLGLEGEVKIRFMVDKEGTVSDVTIVESTPPDIFNKSVINAVSTWKYTPGELSGRQVATIVTTTILFKLEGQ
ncbi:MAG: energy transducer TonB [Desulfobacteraceae bacterium]|nr:energy transducer TonB [Desulfobacteraceae bacterium]